MPYIDQDDRKFITETDSFGQLKIICDNIRNPGEVQYAIAEILKSYMDRKGLNYQNCNDIMGALAGAQMEFYRRIVAPYEDSKIETNGDI